jgi:hypothetical protein
MSQVQKAWKAVALWSTLRRHYRQHYLQAWDTRIDCWQDSHVDFSFSWHFEPFFVFSVLKARQNRHTSRPPGSETKLAARSPYFKSAMVSRPSLNLLRCLLRARRCKSSSRFLIESLWIWEVCLTASRSTEPLPGGFNISIHSKEHSKHFFDSNFTGHFRNLNWRYLPYIRPI